MAPLILWAVASMGLTHIVVSGSIFKGLRERLDGTTLGKMIRCYQCFGFWSGIITWLLLEGSTWSTNQTILGYRFLSYYFSSLHTLLLCGFCGSFLGMASAVVLDWLEHNERNNEE